MSMIPKQLCCNEVMREVSVVSRIYVEKNYKRIQCRYQCEQCGQRRQRTYKPSEIEKIMGNISE